MSSLNPNIRIAKSKGIDLPILYVYLAGRICGKYIDLCLKWRRDIINSYKNYEKDENGKIVSYPIGFLCPLNSGESKSIDNLGLTSHISPNMIYHKDLLSVNRADIVIANMEDFFEEDLHKYQSYTYDSKEVLIKKLHDLENKILNRRENMGTLCEVAWALRDDKPLILIVSERRREIFEKHPFMKRASVIVTSVEQLIKEKHLETLYKAIAGAIYK